MDHLLRLRATAVFFCTALTLIALTIAPAFVSAAVPSSSLPSRTDQPASLLAATGIDVPDDDLLSGSGPAEPLLTILYNADTYGETQPCPT